MQIVWALDRPYPTPSQPPSRFSRIPIQSLGVSPRATWVTFSGDGGGNDVRPEVLLPADVCKRPDAVASLAETVSALFELGAGVLGPTQNPQRGIPPVRIPSKIPSEVEWIPSGFILTLHNATGRSLTERGCARVPCCGPATIF